jgi:hypothetical protein
MSKMRLSLGPGATPIGTALNPKVCRVFQAITRFLQQDGITIIGGLSGHGKTWIMLAMVRALLEGGKLFHYFRVAEPSARVIYLIPEAGLSSFVERIQKFHLEKHVRAGRFFYQTLSSKHPLTLTDPRMLAAVKGADVFLDTVARFATGEENSATEQKLFAETLFRLQRAGARTIVGAHHAPKSFEKAELMTLENILRGSGDIGAMLTTCWGLRQLDAASNRIFLQNVKARDFEAAPPFIIQGRPSIDNEGYFELTEPPGYAGTLSDNKAKVGRPLIADKESKTADAKRLKEQGMSIREVAGVLRVGKGSVERMLKS